MSDELHQLENFPTVNQNSLSQRSEIDPNDLAVCVEGAWKNYGTWWKSTTALHGVTLHVPRGVIYGLLGPSGCGKTTLLRCIVGRLQLNRGEITVLGERPGTRGHQVPGRAVGFMPQETALYKDFSISEMLHYFGHLHNMDRKDIISREKFLLSFLDLPSGSKKICQLSGGQQRRVSLACALLQQPQLLILDEPTVGVDPLLREKIWDHLLNISKTSRTTIIITTHYIEEARKADRVGLMRSGRMLAEDEPSRLLTIYRQSSLEDVFLVLCQADQTRNLQTLPRDGQNHLSPNNEVQCNPLMNTTNDEPPQLQIRKKELVKNPVLRAKRAAVDCCICPHMHKIYALMVKDLTVMKRDIGFLMFQFLIPVIQIALFCLCIGRDPQHISMALYNKEAISGYPTGNLSLDLLAKINQKDIHFTQFSNLPDATEAVRQGHLWGVVAIRSNFTQSVKDKLLSFKTDSTTLDSSSLHLHLDMTNQQISFVMQNVLLTSTQLFLKDLLSANKFDRALADPPVIIEQPIYGAKIERFLNFAAPGMMISIIFFSAIGLTALIFVVEKKEGLLERSWIAGVTTVEVMLAHIIVKFFVQFIQIILMVIFADMIFNVQIRGPALLAMALIFIQGLCGMSYGLLISAICEQEVEVMEVALGSVFPILLSSGVIWPAEGMPPIMLFLSNFTPLTHVVEAMRCIVSRGWTLIYFKVWFGFVISGAWSCGFFALAAILFALRK